jgi:zinc transporter ZupT
LPNTFVQSLSVNSLLLTATGAAVLSAAAGIWLMTVPRRSTRLVLFSAGLLLGFAAFGIWPELAETFGWLGGLVLLCSGFILLWTINRYVYPVCPACSHTHDHNSCAITLHGFALPLIAAAIVHSMLDGWGIAASRENGSGSAGMAVFLGVALHKIPEGLAYGAILRAALRSRFGAFAGVVFAQSPTMAGDLVNRWWGAYLGHYWMGLPLALVGGSFLFLAFHAVHGDVKRRGVAPALAPALTGLAGAALLHQGLHLFLH